MAVRLARWLLLAVVIFSGLPATGRAALEQMPTPGPADASSPPCGIGAVLVMRQDGAAVVTQIIPGGPADRDGQLKVNDQIAGVAQGNAAFVDCTGMTLARIVSMVRGKKGTTVRLQVIPAGAADPTKLTVIKLIRAEIQIGGQLAPRIAPRPNAVQAPEPATGAALSPALEAKLAEFEKKIDEARRKLLLDYMKKEMDEVVQVTGLDDAGKKALEDISAQSVDQCLKKSDGAHGTLGDLLRSEWKQVPAGQIGMMLKQMDAQIDTAAKWFQSQQGIWPVDMPAWTDGLKKTLTAAQAAAWQSAETTRKQAVEKEIGGFLDTVAKFCTQQQKRVLDAKVAELEGSLTLPQDQLDKLNALEQSVLQKSADGARSRAEKSLLAMDEDERKQAIAGQGYYAWYEQGPDTAWDDGVAALLTPEEKNSLKAGKENYQALRVAAMGKLMVALLDDRIAFTAAQRQLLEPIAQRLVKNAPDLVADQEAGNYFSFSTSEFYGAASTGSSDDVKAILDPIQWRHWQELAKLKDEDDNSEQQAIQLPPPDDPDKPHPPPEPEDVECAISDFIHDKSKAEREKVLSEKILKAEDIARVAHLEPGAAERLQTAARGGADEYMTIWNLAIERTVRSQLGDGLSAQTVKQRLASIQNYQFGDSFMQMPERSPNQLSVWDKTLKTEVTADQQKAWKAETDARAGYKRGAIVAVILSIFDQRLGLSPQQRLKLDPLVAKIVNDYAEDFGGFMSPESAWYMESFSMFLPMAGVPEKDMKAILTKEQWEHWTQSQEFANASSNWQNINQMHQQRLKGGGDN